MKRFKLVALIAGILLGTSTLSLSDIYTARQDNFRASGKAEIAEASDCSQTSVGFTPLTELKNDKYKGYKGGLYPKGKNDPPKKYHSVGKGKASKVRPRDSDGSPSAGGKIALLSIGMSNTKHEFRKFEAIAETDNDLAEAVVIVNGAQGGRDAAEVREADSPYWQEVDQALDNDHVTAQQVQAVWLKQAFSHPDETFPDDAKRLRAALADIVGILKKRFANLRLIYVSSRIYAGYASSLLNPEPYAYQSGFAVKWLIKKRIRSIPTKRPWVAWGPYLWADGEVERNDGLVWHCKDFRTDDGTHPSDSGKEKVAKRLLTFFKRRPTTKSWFVGD